MNTRSKSWFWIVALALTAGGSWVAIRKLDPSRQPTLPPDRSADNSILSLGTPHLADESVAASALIDPPAQFDSVDLEHRYFQLHAEQEHRAAQGLEIASARLTDGLTELESSRQGQAIRAIVETRIAELRERAKQHQSRAAQYRSRLGNEEAM